ncbi:glucans biosynthesis glucosyltransferase MdoH [Marinobacter salicampi]|uniref:glucans biosynthesis glucosyltransferase MdoH n=1 Tax=Marinobacter salicampi TaxID=435907 RepID=UPI001409C742|nr:glucans biosynthesis glucosyltransferase MdoH [Marinobacter salicampi]
MVDAVVTAHEDIVPPPGKVRWRGVAFFRRTLLILLVLGQTSVACYYLLWVLPYHGSTWVEKGLVVLFAILYAWIAVGFWTAVIGLILRLGGGDRYSLLKRHNDEELAATTLAPTAVVMPIYHEPVQRTLRGLRAVYRDIERTGQLEHFEFYILSDSRDPNVWLEEQAAWQSMCDELGADGRLFYRRRTVNLNYKSGNVADFLRRWGRRCKYMIVLDADSLLSGRTLVKMVQLMQREPGTGILQTNPNVINGRSLFARLQQFANRVYSPLFSTGLAAIQMGDAAFWGHNAIIRVDAFMAHCGLRKLPGFGLFSGPIMSHDFVEAAYMGRAGYEVWLEPGLGESYEESPPSLADELTRDERWSKGNLQHLWIMLFGRGIRFAHRLAFFNGIMAYVASPLWLAFLVLTTVEAAQMALAPINYFPEGYHGLFPLWPEWRPIWAVTLALSTLALLFLPKFMAILDVVVKRQTAAFGGFLRLIASVFVEIGISVLLAPIRMLAHSRYVLGALFNLSLHWGGQNRTEATSWRQAFMTQLPGTIAGLAWSAFAWNLDIMFFFWSLPVAIPLVLAAPTSVLLSRNRPGDALRRRKLLLIPEELRPPVLLNDTTDEHQLLPPIKGLTRFEEAVLAPRVNHMHQSFARTHRGQLRRETLGKLVRRCLKDGPAALTRSELSHLCRDRDSLLDLHKGAWRSNPDSFWGRRLAVLADES